MAKPSYDEVIGQRNAAREEVEALKKQLEAGQPDGLADALERVRVLEAEKAALIEKLAQLANGLTEAAPSAPAIHEIPDDDPADPRPDMHPALGWSDPAVIAWAERRRAKKGEPVTITE